MEGGGGVARVSIFFFKRIQVCFCFNGGGGGGVEVKEDWLV